MVKMRIVAGKQEATREKRSRSVSTRFSLGMENEWADAGQDSRKSVSRDNIIRRERGQGKTIFFDDLITSRIGQHTRLMHSLL